MEENKRRLSRRKWWYWAAIAVVFACVFGQRGSGQPVAGHSGAQEISLMVTDISGDSGQKRRMATTGENIEMQDYALYYYQKYFHSDDEVHGIVNLCRGTTTRITVAGEHLVVKVYMSVPGEESELGLLFTGTLLQEYHVDIRSGEVKVVL